MLVSLVNLSQGQSLLPPPTLRERRHRFVARGRVTMVGIFEPFAMSAVGRYWEHSGIRMGFFAAVRVRALWGVTRNLRKPSGVTEMSSTAVVVFLQSGRDQPLFWAR